MARAGPEYGGARPGRFPGRPDRRENGAAMGKRATWLHTLDIGKAADISKYFGRTLCLLEFACPACGILDPRGLR